MVKVPKLSSQAELREQVHNQMDIDLRNRLATNSQPTDFESNIGVFIEQLEPQVRDAVRMMYRKGYLAMSSGFGMRKTQGDIQMIDGRFKIDQETKEKLGALGVEVNEEDDAYGNKETSILFTSREADTDAIAEQWAKVVGTLPEQGKEAGPSPNSDAFVLRFSPDNREQLIAIVAQKVKLGFYSFESKRNSALEAELRKGSGPNIDAAIQELKDEFEMRSAEGEFKEWDTPQDNIQVVDEILSEIKE